MIGTIGRLGDGCSAVSWRCYSRIIVINESEARATVNSNPSRLAENRKCPDSAPTLGLTNFAPESS
jgi:hypothetical protein